MSTIAPEPGYDFHHAVRIAEAGRADDSDLRIRRRSWTAGRWIRWGVDWRDQCGAPVVITAPDMDGTDWQAMPAICRAERTALEQSNAAAVAVVTAVRAKIATAAKRAADPGPATVTQPRPVPNGRTPIAATPTELAEIDEMVPGYMARCATCAGGGEVDTGTEVSPRECPDCYGTGGVTPRLIDRIRMLVADAARTRSGDVG